MFVGGPALADDVRVPAWRGSPGSVLTEFDTWATAPADPAVFVPDSFTQWPADPLLDGAIAEPDGVGAQVLASFESRSTVLELPKDRTLMIELDNFDQQNPYKTVQVQITYHDSGCAPWWLYVDYAWDNDDDDFDLPIHDLQDKVTYDLENGWKALAFTFAIEPNPWEEQIEVRFFDFGAATKTVSYIDQVVVDTICLPEPGSLALFALVGLALAGRRRPS